MASRDLRSLADDAVFDQTSHYARARANDGAPAEHGERQYLRPFLRRDGVVYEHRGRVGDHRARLVQGGYHALFHKIIHYAEVFCTLGFDKVRQHKPRAYLAAARQHERPRTALPEPHRSEFLAPHRRRGAQDILLGHERHIQRKDDIYALARADLANAACVSRIERPKRPRRVIGDLSAEKFPLAALCGQQPHNDLFTHTTMICRIRFALFRSGIPLAPKIRGIKS